MCCPIPEPRWCDDSFPDEVGEFTFCPSLQGCVRECAVPGIFEDCCEELLLPKTALEEGNSDVRTLSSPFYSSQNFGGLSNASDTELPRTDIQTKAELILGVVTGVLMQLPAICLGLYGVVRVMVKTGLSVNALRASVVILIPFSILQIYVTALDFLAAKVGSVVTKYDPLFFVESDQKKNKGQEKLYYINNAKVFFGSAIQFCFQAWILRKAMFYSLSRTSQYFSVISSSAKISKTATNLFTHEEVDDEKDGPEEKQTFKDSMMQALNKLKLSLYWMPLILSSLLYKIGIMILYTDLLGWSYTLLMILIVFILNLISCVLYIPWRSGPNDDIVNERQSIMDEVPRVGKVYTSYTNIFVISKPPHIESDAGLRIALLLQPLQFVFTLGFTIFFIAWNHEDTSFLTMGFSIMVCVMGITNLVVCYITWRKVNRDN